jgi:O-acetyl-ADP-ribose deacetylase (regulator of RNase III)
MITYVEGDLFQSPAKVLVNTVNTVGVMGKGIALQFKQIYPEMFKKYQKLCEKNQLQVGQLWLYKTPHKWILNFPTKEHWRSKSKLEYIEAGLIKFVETYQDKGIQSISFPALGCGNGELDWASQVLPLMQRYLDDLPIDIYIHVYSRNNSLPEHRDIAYIKQWLNGEPKSLSYVEVWDDIKALIKNKSLFHTLKSNTPFTVHVTFNEGIMITHAEASFIIEKDDLLDLWQYLRNAGYIHTSILPAHFVVHSEYFVSLLQELPYISAIPISIEADAIFDNWGLQLIPPVAETILQVGQPEVVKLI